MGARVFVTPFTGVNTHARMLISAASVDTCHYAQVAAAGQLPSKMPAADGRLRHQVIFPRAS